GCIPRQGAYAPLTRTLNLPGSGLRRPRGSLCRLPYSPHLKLQIRRCLTIEIDVLFLPVSETVPAISCAFVTGTVGILRQRKSSESSAGEAIVRLDNRLSGLDGGSEEVTPPAQAPSDHEQSGAQDRKRSGFRH